MAAFKDQLSVIKQVPQYRVMQVLYFPYILWTTCCVVLVCYTNDQTALSCTVYVSNMVHMQICEEVGIKLCTLEVCIDQYILSKMTVNMCSTAKELGKLWQGKQNKKQKKLLKAEYGFPWKLILKELKSRSTE